MRWQRTDLAVGVLVLASVVLLGYVVAWSVSEGGEQSSYSLYAVFDDATGIAVQAPVVLQGYRVGAVQSIDPEHTDGGRLRFRVRLGLDRALSGDVPLQLPIGTQAELMYRGFPLGAGTIALVLPEESSGILPPGATIPGEHATTALDEVQGATEQLTVELQTTLATARTLMDTLSHTAATADAAVRGLREDLRPVLVGLDRELVAAEALTRDARTHFAEVMPRATAGVDSATVLLRDIHRLVNRLDVLVATNEPRLTGIVANLDTTAVLVEHLTREFSRRPLRMLFSGSDEEPYSSRASEDER